MKLKTAWFALLLLAWVVAVILVARRPTPEPPVVPQGPTLPAEIVPQKSEAELRAERDAFFAADVEPRIKEADKLNREAADRCVARLTDSFNSYRTGIQPFCEEINTWGTRLGVVKRHTTDWWYKQNDVIDYIQAKFAKHLFTAKKLVEDIDSVLTQFRADVEANQNNLVTSIRAAISSKDLPGLPNIDYQEFAKELSPRLTEYTQWATDWAIRGIVTEVASGVGGQAAEQIFARLVPRLTAWVGASTASAGGATAGGAAVGGGGGLIGGPLGVAAGIAVGLVIGVVIDWWMSSSFEAKMTEQLNGLIDELNKVVIVGDANRPGLRDALRGSCDIIRQGYQDTLRAKIVNGGVL